MTYEEALQRLYVILRNHTGRPLFARYPMLMVQNEDDGTASAALCSHVAYGRTQDEALQNLLAQFEGGECGKEKESQSGRTEPPREIQ